MPLRKQDKNVTCKQGLRALSHLMTVTMTQTFYVVSTTFKLGCTVANVTVHNRRQEKTDKKDIVVVKCEQALTESNGMNLVSSATCNRTFQHYCS